MREKRYSKEKKGTQEQMEEKKEKVKEIIREVFAEAGQELEETERGNYTINKRPEKQERMGKGIVCG